MRFNKLFTSNFKGDFKNVLTYDSNFKKTIINTIEQNITNDNISYKLCTVINNYERIENIMEDIKKYLINKQLILEKMNIIISKYNGSDYYLITFNIIKSK